MTPLKIICGCGHNQNCDEGEVSLRRHTNYEDRDRAPKDQRLCDLPLARI